jgi:hypothetical protein
VIVEHVDRRVLGAIRFVDAVTRATVDDRLSVSAPDVAWHRNDRGWFVVSDAPGLHHHTHAFAAAPTDVAPGSVGIRVTVRDPGGRYLPRQYVLRLPRSADPSGSSAADSLFRPADVPLFRSPAAPVALGWAAVRVTVTADGTGRRLGGALLRVLSADAVPVLLATGLTDERGEGLAIVPDVPVTTFGSGPTVLAVEMAVTVQAVVPVTDAAVADPDAIESSVGTAAVRSAAVENVKLASGRIVVLPVVVAL